jgi:hypothetical protein
VLTVIPTVDGEETDMNQRTAKLMAKPVTPLKTSTTRSINDHICIVFTSISSSDKQIDANTSHGLKKKRFLR